MTEMPRLLVPIQSGMISPGIEPRMKTVPAMRIVVMSMGRGMITYGSFRYIPKRMRFLVIMFMPMLMRMGLSVPPMRSVRSRRIPRTGRRIRDVCVLPIPRVVVMIDSARTIPLR
jgi:hypothetical protein